MAETKCEKNAETLRETKSKIELIEKEIEWTIATVKTGMEEMHADVLNKLNKVDSLQTDITALEKLYEKLIVRFEMTESKINDFIENYKHKLEIRKNSVLKIVISLITFVLISGSGWIYSAVSEYSKSDHEKAGVEQRLDKLETLLNKVVETKHEKKEINYE